MVCFFITPITYSLGYIKICWVIFFSFYVVELFLVTAHQLVPALMVQMLTVWWQSTYITYSTLYHK